MPTELTIALIGAAAVVIGMFIRLEHRLTAIEIHISWLKREVSKCLPTSEVDSG